MIHSRVVSSSSSSSSSSMKKSLVIDNLIDDLIVDMISQKFSEFVDTYALQRHLLGCLFDDHKNAREGTHLLW